MTVTVFVDIESTGLFPTSGAEAWEVAMIRREDGKRTGRFVWHLPVDLGRADPFALQISRFYERRWPAVTSRSTAHLGSIHPDAVSSGILDGTWDPDYDVHRARRFRLDPPQMPAWAERFSELTRGATWVGAVPDFDATRFLDPLLREYGQNPGWHYHIRDVETLAVGHLHGYARAVEAADLLAPAVRAREIADQFQSASWDSEDLSRAVGVDPDRFDRHTAMGDCEWAEAIYDAVMGTGE